MFFFKYKIVFIINTVVKGVAVYFTVVVHSLWKYLDLWEQISMIFEDW